MMSIDTRMHLGQIADIVGIAGATTTGRGTTIALVDTGVAPHRLLDDANIVIGPDFSAEAGQRGIDTHGHGTHMAGIVSTLAPGATLLSVRAGGAGAAPSPDAIAEAIDWVTFGAPADGMPVDVLLLAYTVDRDLPGAEAVEAAVQRAWDAGITVVVAAGNDGQAGLLAPATVSDVIAVGALAGDALADFSTRGDLVRDLDLVAPGRSIVSARAVGAAADAENLAGRVGDDLVAATGSSQAAAVVAAVAAHVLEGTPLVNRELKAVLTASARPVAGTRAGLVVADQAATTASLSQDLTTIAAVATTPAWAAGRWTAGRWTGTRWNAGRWTAGRWTGTRWNAGRWTAGRWTAGRWTGASWAAGRWTAGRWTAGRWTGIRWA